MVEFERQNPDSQPSVLATKLRVMYVCAEICLCKKNVKFFMRASRKTKKKGEIQLVMLENLKALFSEIFLQQIFFLCAPVLKRLYQKRHCLLHGELPQRWHGGEHLLSEIFYAGNRKWLNALQFLQAEEEYKPRQQAPERLCMNSLCLPL